MSTLEPTLSVESTNMDPTTCTFMVFVASASSVFPLACAKTNSFAAPLYTASTFAPGRIILCPRSVLVAELLFANSTTGSSMTMFVEDTYVVAPRTSSAPVITVVGASIVTDVVSTILGVVTFADKVANGATSRVAAVNEPITSAFISCVASGLNVVEDVATSVYPMINFLDDASYPHATFEFAAPSCSPMNPTSDTPLTPTPRPRIGSFKSLFVTSNCVVVPMTCRLP